jgi:hemerythrin-like metal-binding protein
MTLMIWTEEMSVGVKELDDDHKQLIGMLNVAQETLSSARSREALEEVLDRLVEMTKAHFVHEERLFDQAGFPGAEAHRREHDLMLAAALKWQAHFKSGRPPFLSVENLNGFESWLDNHIEGADMLYGPHLNAAGIC